MGNVLCAGELLIDFICTDRGTTLADSENFIKKCGGAPFNVSIAIQKLGANAIMCGSVGDDSFGESLINELVKYNVSCDNVKKLKTNTTLAYVSLTNEGERDFIFVRGADELYTFDSVNKSDLEKCNVFHFGSATAFLGGDLAKTYDQLLEYGIKNNKVIVFDPNYRTNLFSDKKELFVEKSKQYIKYSDIVKVSEEEAFILTNESDNKKAGQELVNLGAKYVLITRGKEGTLVFSKDEFKEVKSEPVKMVDATGAGDAFIGAIVSKVSNEGCNSFEKLIEYVEVGNKVGAMVVQKYGSVDAIPFFSEI